MLDDALTRFARLRSWQQKKNWMPALAGTARAALKGIFAYFELSAIQDVGGVCGAPVLLD